jgi:probable addiction module antidote protein
MIYAEYDEDLMEHLRDPEIAFMFIKDALEDDEMPGQFLLALRKVTEAHGMTNIAKLASLNRVNLYRILSENGNPELKSLHSILNVLGFRLSIDWKEAS